MADVKRHERTVVSTTGVKSTVQVFACSYCGHHVTGTAPNYTNEAGSIMGTGGPFACPARGGSLPHSTF